jgi:hypothetical protein
MTPESDPLSASGPADARALTLHWIFRIAVFMEFVGHGAYGILKKSAWVPYFGVAGIPGPTAYHLMPIVGSCDILVGISVLLFPIPAVLFYTALWGTWTSLLRPLSGEPVWEAVERAYNYGVPLTFLIWSGVPGTARGWFARIAPRAPRAATMDRVRLILRFVCGLMLIGHGALGAISHKQMLGTLYASVGLHSVPVVGWPIVPAIGWFEIALGFAILIRPLRGLLLFTFVWKIASEILYPISGTKIWEFVERGGSYAAPLALYILSRPPITARNGGTGSPGDRG